jgi:hypothetical protein
VEDSENKHVWHEQGGISKIDCKLYF